MRGLLTVWSLMTVIAVSCWFLFASYGAEYERVSCVAFSSDGSRLAVVKHEADDAGFTFKRYKRDVSRTVSVLRSPSLKTESIVEQKFWPGNQGPAFGLFKYARDIIAFIERRNSLVVCGIGGITIHDLDLGVQKGLPVTGDGPFMIHRATPDELVCGHWRTVLVIRAETGAISRRINATMEGFSSGPIVAVSSSSPEIAVVDDEGAVHLWETKNGRRLSTVFKPKNLEEEPVRSLAIDPTRRLVTIATPKGLRQYDYDGKFIRTLASASETMLIRISRNSKLIAAASFDEIKVFDAETGKNLYSLPADDRCTCLDFTADAGLLAAGDNSGQVSLWDMTNGQLRAVVTPPGRERPSAPKWPIILLVLSVGLCVVLLIRLAKRRATLRQSVTLPNS